MKNKKFLSLVLAIAMLVSMLSVGIGSISASARTIPAADIRVSYGTLSIHDYDGLTDAGLVESINEMVESDKQNGTTVVEEIVKIDLDDCTELTDISILFSTFPNVENFNSKYSEKLSSVEGISNWTKLKSLNITYCQLTDISDVFNCPNLESLYIGVSNISSIEGISKCSNLTSVGVSLSPLNDISEIYQLENLKSITLNTNNISDPTGLVEYCKSNSNLTSMYIDNNPMANYHEYLSELKNLDIYFNYLPYSNISSKVLDKKIIKTERTSSVEVDNENKIITVNSLKDGNYVVFCEETVGDILDFSIQTDDNITADEPRPYYRYYINKPDGASVLETTIMVNSSAYNYDRSSAAVEYKLVVNFLEEDNFDPEVVNVRNAVETTFDKTNMTFEVKSEGNYVRIYKALSNGARIKVNASCYDFITEYPFFYQINKAVLSSKTAEFDIAVSYGLNIKGVVNFVEKAPVFDASKLTLKNATNKAFDADNSALTIDTEANYVRVYKALTNGSTVSVDAEKYDFVVEYDKFYQINKAALALSDLNIATFEMTTDSGDTVTTTVNFPGAGELPFTKLFKITNYDSLTQEENVINLDIVDTKTFSIIYKDVADGSTLTIESDSAFVEERDNCYVLRQRAVGETITMTYGDTTYTINLTK